MFLVGVEKQSEFAGKRKRIESESRSGILYKRREGDGKDYHQAVFDVSNTSSSSYG